MEHSNRYGGRSGALLGWVLFYTFLGAAVVVVGLYLSRGQYVLAAAILLPFVLIVLAMLPDLRRYWLPERLGGEK